MKIQEVRAKSQDELNGQLIDLKKAQYNLRIQKVTGQLEKSGEIRKIRRSIARVKTVMGEIERGVTVTSKAEKTSAKAKASGSEGKKTKTKKSA